MNQAMKEFPALLIREYWEHKRSILWVPAGFSILISLLILMISFGVFDIRSDIEFSDLVQMARSVEDSGSDGSKKYITQKLTVELDGEDQVKALSVLADRDRLIFAGLHLYAMVFGMLAFFLGVSYLLASLHTDRKDRSILFWKSLPFSESQAVASKLLIAALIIPVIAFIFSIVVQLAVGIGVTYLYVGLQESMIGLGAYFEMFFKVLLTHSFLIFLVAIKLMPFFSWLIFCSAWSKGTPMLLSFLVPFCFYIFERLIVGTNYIGRFFSSVISYSGDGSLAALESGNIGVIMKDMLHYSPSQLVFGVIISITFIYGAIWLRNNKYEI
ncbi:MAG: hypothetical protein ACRBCS_05675 [Cellvibrionaceae bacterium]